MGDLTEFLKQREVSEEIIQTLENEKVLNSNKILVEMQLFLIVLKLKIELYFQGWLFQ